MMKALHFDLLLELYPWHLPDAERVALLDAFRHLAVALAFCRGEQDIPLPEGVEDETPSPLPEGVEDETPSLPSTEAAP